MKPQLHLPFSENDLHGDHWEYLFLASPDRGITARVMEIKEDFYSVHKQKIAIDTRPHITLACFKARENLEAGLIELIQKACGRHQTFAVNLCDFDGFDHSTIYIKVEEHQPFLRLADSLRVINDILLPNGGRGAFFVRHPHLTIARRIPYRVYLKAICDYRSRNFKDRFVVNELILLRRRHEKEKCKRVTTLRLSPADYFLN